MSDLNIDAEKAIRDISQYLKGIVAKDRTDGVILGLSGGLDSCVMAALAVRALGPGSVSVVYLFDHDSDPDIADNARLMAEFLGLDLEVIEITKDMENLKIYSPLFMKLLRISKLMARISASSYKLICGETPFQSTLRVGRGEVLKPWYKRFLFNTTIRHLDNGFTQRHVFRRAVLEKLAQERNLSLIGAANLSECEVGWFVKDGIDDVPVQPMTGLYKTQVRQLAKELGLPERVRSQLPSPDMANGITDEFGIGHDYADVDIVVDGFHEHLSNAEIAAQGVPEPEIEDIRKLMKLSDWKRQSPHEAPPVSGVFGSPLRTNSAKTRDTHKTTKVTCDA
ncbi:NAD(+) synthase [Marivita hallyeonensis]|uniref:NH(3)-dependent NAD(+) synthetase n=1 Tax=Marivita hallyeonensis TaxID=996342 RepID=A0A1M5XD48_9RHOB|nr:NAD(+) synthase [Marivita hallyeonensis]SHH97785.1 NAD+ synthase [Marivita hallyeonensis]